MATFTDKNFEEAYKNFIQTQSEWQALLIDLKITSDTDMQGTEFRHVGFTSDKKVLAQAQHLLAEWERFANLCEEKRKDKQLTILKESYAPVPYILEAESSTTISHRPAYTTTDIPREGLISRYDNLIKKFGSSKLAAALIEQLKKERKNFIDQPPATIYRLRSYGFTETSITQHGIGNADTPRLLVGAHGVLIFSKTLKKKDIIIKELQQSNQSSIYDRMTPIKTSLFERGELYTHEQLEFEKRYREAYRFVTKKGITMKNGWEKNENLGREKYRGTDKYPDFIKRINLLRPKRQYMIEQDLVLVERMREIGEFVTTTIVDVRARFLLDSEIATGYFPKSVERRREELIAEGVPLYQDMIKSKK